MDIGPGDYLESLRTVEAQLGFREVVSGKLYCVEAVTPPGQSCDGCGDVGPGIRLVGDRQPLRWSWCVCGFRQIYRPSATLIESLKRPAREPVKEDA